MITSLDNATPHYELDSEVKLGTLDYTKDSEWDKYYLRDFRVRVTYRKLARALHVSDHCTLTDIDIDRDRHIVGLHFHSPDKGCITPEGCEPATFDVDDWENPSPLGLTDPIWVKFMQFHNQPHILEQWEKYLEWDNAERDLQLHLHSDDEVPEEPTTSDTGPNTF